MNNQILAACSSEKIRYNVYNLVKAFFPGSNVITELHEDQAVPVIVRSVCGPFASNDRTADIAGFPEDFCIEAQDIRTLYRALADKCGRSLPWGMLMGVRPVKLASDWISRNLQHYASAAQAKSAFAGWFYEDRAVSAEKAELAFDIAFREKQVLERAFSAGGRLDVIPGESIYVSIPFCPSVCRYCSFSSGSIDRYADRVDAYLDALFQEMNRRAGSMDRTAPHTVYIGGGTPTSLDEVRFERLLSQMDRIFGIRDGISRGIIQEYTIEAGRPDSITKEKLGLMKEYGASRISINPQTMQQKTLDAVGRRHTVGQVYQAFETARALGFDNINMDLILALPGESDDDVRDTLRQVRTIQPDSLTVHCLAVKRSSAFGESARSRLLSGNRKQAEEKPEKDREQTVLPDVAGMIRDAYEAAEQMGLSPYYLYRQKNISGNFENIGYAACGKEGLYNIVMMEEVQSIAAFGAGASSKQVLAMPVPNPDRSGRMTRILRTENPKNIDEYIKRQ